MIYPHQDRAHFPEPQRWRLYSYGVHNLEDSIREVQYHTVRLCHDTVWQREGSEGSLRAYNVEFNLI